MRSSKGCLQLGLMQHLDQRTVHSERSDKTKEKGLERLGAVNCGGKGNLWGIKVEKG